MKRKYGIALALAALIALGFAVGQWMKSSELVNMMSKFSVKVENRSDADIVIVAAGLEKGESRDEINRTVKSGDSFLFKPDLNVQGENSVYMEHTDASGKMVKTMICGYTEYLSGSSQVTIGDTIAVKEDCH